MTKNRNTKGSQRIWEDTRDYFYRGPLSIKEGDFFQLLLTQSLYFRSQKNGGQWFLPSFSSQRETDKTWSESPFSTCLVGKWMGHNTCVCYEDSSCSVLRCLKRDTRVTGTLHWKSPVTLVYLNVQRRELGLWFSLVASSPSTSLRTLSSCSGSLDLRRGFPSEGTRLKGKSSTDI